MINNYDEHYQSMGMQPLEAMRSILTYKEYTGFLKGNIIKYCMRAGRKQDEEASKDYAKAKRYAEILKNPYNYDPESDFK